MTTHAVHRPLRVTPTRVAKSEWVKFWSLRSTVVTLAVGIALLVGIGLLASSMFDNPTAGAAGPGGGLSNAVSASLGGTTFAQLAFGTLGVLFMAGEYSTGMIRSSLSAVPRRLPVLWSKIAVFTGVVFVVALAGSVVAFTGGQALIGAHGASLTDAGVVRAVIGTALVLTGSGVMGIGLGALLRSTAGAISTLVGGLFLLSGVASLLLPHSWSTVLEYLPSNAASAFTAVHQASDALGPWSALVVYLAYVVAIVIAAAGRLKRSDA